MPPPARPPVLPQRAYVWQRHWSAELREQVRLEAPAFAALDVLAAEVTWPRGEPTVHRLSPDWAALRDGSRPVGLVIRIGPFAGSWSPDTTASQTVVELARSLLAEAESHGVTPVELQLDFDAATSRLTAYQTLLKTVRREVHPPRLVVTALPAWFGQAGFAALIQTVDGYVLQVHSLEKPASFTADFTLCDPARARRWIETASRLGRPFRVALPTYGYRLIFDDAGGFKALEAEGPTHRWPPAYRTRVVQSDPAALAVFVRDLLDRPPAGCEALAWFRLPGPGDELSWSWPTLRAVMQGKVPAGQLSVSVRPQASGTLDVTVVNTGAANLAPAAFRVTWRDARLVAADALGGWLIERVDPHTLVFRPPPLGSNGELRPTDRIPVGWLRLDRPELPTTAVLSSTPSP